MELRTINEVIPGMKTGSGIFTAFTDPIWNELFSDTDLDIFFAGTYGQKYISPYTDLFVGEDGKISNVDLVSFANAVYSIRSNKHLPQKHHSGIRIRTANKNDHKTQNRSHCERHGHV